MGENGLYIIYGPRCIDSHALYDCPRASRHRLLFLSVLDESPIAWLHDGA